MTKTMSELLKELNQAIIDGSDLRRFKDIKSLQTILKHATVPEMKFILPEGLPPFKQDPGEIGVNPTNLHVEARRLYIFCRADLKPVKREALFIELLESLHKDDVHVLLLVKDQELLNEYPHLKQYAEIMATVN